MIKLACTSLGFKKHDDCVSGNVSCIWQENNEEFSCSTFSSVEHPPLTNEKSEQLTVYRIHFQPPQDIYLRGLNRSILFQQLASLGKYAAFVHTEKIPELIDINPELCYCWWDIILATDKGINAIKDVFIFIENESKLEINIIETIDSQNPDTDYKKLGEILLEKGDVSYPQLNQILN